MEQKKAILLSDKQILEFKVDSNLTRLIPQQVADENLIIPWKYDPENGIFYILMSDPSNQQTIDELKLVLEGAEFRFSEIRLLTGSAETIKAAIDKNYEGSLSALQKTELEILKSTAEAEGADIFEYSAFLKNILLVDEDRKSAEKFVALFETECTIVTLKDNLLNIETFLKESKFDLLLVKSRFVTDSEEFIKMINSIDEDITIKVFEEYDSLISMEPVEYNDFYTFYFDSIDFLINLLEADNSLFRNHSHDVAFLSKKVAEKLNFQRKKTDEISISAYLHDFGDIIRKRKRDEELKTEEMIQAENITILLNLIDTLHCPYNVKKIIECLYENFDGSGNIGLSGNDIPIGSRIIAAVNAYDETIKAENDLGIINKEKGFRYLRENSGVLFDPALVEIIISIVKTELDFSKAEVYEEFQESILFFDEENNNTNLAKFRLIHEGFKVFFTNDETKAAEYYNTETPDLIIISANNFSFIENLKRKYPSKNIRFILLASRDLNFTLDMAENCKAEDLINKPVNIETLVKKVKKIFDKYRKRAKNIVESAHFYEKSGNYNRAGNLFREIGDLVNAARMYEKANEWKLSADIYMEEREYELAASTYETGGLYELAADAYGKAENYIKQNMMFEKIGDFYSAGKNLCERGSWEEALRYLQRVSKNTDSYIKAQFLVGKIFLSKKEYSLALNNFQNCTDNKELSSENIKYYYFIGQLHEKLEKFEEAEKIYEKILTLKVDYEDVPAKLEVVKALLKEKQKSDSFQNQQNKDRYKRIREIGRGGMGVVYEAHDNNLHRTVALKVLSALLKEDKRVTENFKREAQTSAQLVHPNIVTVFDLGLDEDKNLYISMELIKGKTVREILRKEKFTLQKMLEISVQVCKGLKHAHSGNIIHRDLTTSNIMVTEEGIAKIMDFGLARMIEGLKSESSIIGGTPSFMSPEQVEGDPVDHRTDIYTFGVSMFEMSTGEVPFKKGDLGYHHLHTPPPIPKSINPEIPDILNRLILKCLQKKPEDRIQDVELILKELEKIKVR